MRSIRFSIAGLMAVVVAMALGFAALRTASATTLGITLLATRAILGIAIIGAICRRGAERAFWLGFAVCGWIYIRCSLEPYPPWPELPTQALLEALGRVMGIPIDNIPTLGAGPSRDDPLKRSFLKIGHCLWALLFAGLGGSLARFLFGTAAGQSREILTGSQPAEDVQQGRWWLQPLLAFVSGLVIVAAIAIFGAQLTAGLWAGLTFFATCVLLGIAAMGGLWGRGKCREAFLGAAVFGAGFLMLVFARSRDHPWPLLPTFQLLEDAYPWVPIVAKELSESSETTTAANARIRRALQKPVSLAFNEDPPLEDVLDAIQKSIAGTDGEGIPIYVNPLTLSEADKTMLSTVRSFSVKNMPLRVSLERCLDQLDLAYVVRDGVLEITSRESAAYHLLSTAEDAYQVAGHCVLAMIAAALGGIAAPLVCRLPRGS
jgi:hypothetical protein